MKNAIILHGMSESEEDYKDPSLGLESDQHWIPWLQRQLIFKGMETQAPEMPSPYYPVYKDWKRVFEQFSVGEETTLIGHSNGGGFLIRWLSQNPVKIKKLVLVAAWMNPDGTDKRIEPSFYDFAIDPKISERTGSIHAFISSDDNPEMAKTLKQITAVLPEVEVHQFTDHGHFTKSQMGTVEFPELLEAVIG